MILFFISYYIGYSRMGNTNEVYAYSVVKKDIKITKYYKNTF